MADAGLIPDILDYLRLRGIPADRKQSGHVCLGNRWLYLGEPGWPDIIGCLPGGRFLAVECKAPGKELTWEQEQKMHQLQKAGAICVVAMNIADVEKALRKIKDTRDPA